LPLRAHTNYRTPRHGRALAGGPGLLGVIPVVRVFHRPIHGLVDLGQLVQVIDGVVVDLVLAMCRGHIARRGANTAVRTVPTPAAAVRSPPRRILPGRAWRAHGHARKEGELARRACGTHGRRLV